MRIRAIAFTEKGQSWQGVLGFPVERGVPVMQWAREAFADADALLFIGACGIAPAVSINGKVYPKVQVSAVAGIIEELRQQGGM